MSDQEWVSKRDLALGWQTLLVAAEAARERAYAPYSQFVVGAAVRTETGRIYEGCNVENASYGLTVCAERVAIWNALAHGDERIVALALVTEAGDAPCGACRQVMAEFGDEDLSVLVANAQGRCWFTALRELLPYSFTRSDLERPS